MKKSSLLFFIPLILLGLELYGQDRDIYQIKTYLMNSKQQVETTEKFLKDAYLPALKRMGIASVGVFKPKTIDTDSIKKVLVLIPFSSIQAFSKADSLLLKDAAYLTAGADYLNTPFDKQPYIRMESTLLRAFTGHPHLTPTLVTGPREERVYELRSYEASTEALLQNKIEMFNKGGEIDLFDSLQFHAVFYGEVISGDNMPNLMYMTTFSNKANRDDHWKDFFSSPEWKVLSAKSEYKNNVSKADIMFFTPTAYSDY